MRFLNLKARADRKCGEWLQVNIEHDSNQYAGNKALPALKDIGITKNESSRLQKIAAIPEDKFEDILQEAVFTSRWALVEGYHALGARILEDESKFTKGGYTVDGMLQRLATSLSTSERTIRYTIQFVKKYPSLDQVPEGKNITWDKL
jgi:hypothetical protein